MTGLGAPLVVFSDTTTCDGRGHEVHLLTDGTRAYAYTEGYDLPLIRREQETVIVSCRVPDAGDEECHGEATFRLDDPVWVSASLGGDAGAGAALARHGEAMDQ